LTAHLNAPHINELDVRRASVVGMDAGGADKLAARVARDIENDIRELNWPIGEVLGSESELRARYKVSRAVLREAIRLVEHHQVASMRRGPAGGLVVQEPDAGPAADAMIVYLEFVGTTIEHVLAARLLIEPLAAALAAENISELGIARLRRLLVHEHRPRTTASLIEYGNEMHLAIAELSGNPALRLFVDILLRLTTKYGFSASRASIGDSDPMVDTSLDAHDSIVQAVVAGEAAHAELRASQHVEIISEFILGSVASTSVDASASIWARAPGNTTEQKLAEVVARRIISEISDSGWTVGSVIGSESALLERFEVSRAVLREAVRLLEYHSVARMRRGPGGGLVVAEPDPSASIESMALYLDYQRTEIAHLRALRGRIEIGCVDYVAAKSGDPEVAHRLRVAAKDSCASLSAPDHPHRLHTEIAELSENPVLTLFVRVLTTLWARKQTGEAGSGQNAADESESGHSASANSAIDQVHRGLVEALIAGDVSLARHRMRRHVDTLTHWWQ
jgi:DNA-binding FadR family transcriptional regulator